MNDALPPAAVELERPRFQPPEGPPGPTPAAAEGIPSPGRSEDDVGDRVQAAETRTRTKGSSAGSSPGSRAAVTQELADAVYGALVVGFGLAWWLHRRLRRDPGRQLREPTEQDYQLMSLPLGRIVARHVDVDVAPDVALSIKDGAQALGAARHYVARGPLLEHVNLEQPQEGEQPS